jgi:5-(carboxyamino)imidazole ribonucleotide mutase
MPNGIPVATVALNASKNAGILAARILSISDTSLQSTLEQYAAKMRDDVEKSSKDLH